MAQTAAIVNICALNNGTLQDAFQFGPATDLSWDLNGQNFKMEIKASRDDTLPLLTLTSAGGSIIVDDPIQRVIHLNLNDTSLQAAVPVGEYVYDLVMFDGASPPIRTVLMQGKFTLSQGVTED